MRHLVNRHIVTMEGGAELHTRKGWRGLSKPRGTNKRRVLQPAALAIAPLSRQNRLKQTKAGGWWSVLKEGYINWVAERRAERFEREKQEAARILAEQEAALVKEGKVAQVTRPAWQG